jgi:hypothetical protein
MNLEKDQFEEDDELSRLEDDEDLGAEPEAVIEEEEILIVEGPGDDAEEVPVAKAAPKKTAPKPPAKKAAAKVAPKAAKKAAKKPAKKAKKPAKKKAKAKPKKAAKKSAKKKRR